LRIFNGEQRPRNALDADGVTHCLISEGRFLLQAYWPRDPESWIRFREAYGSALRHSLGAAPPQPGTVVVHPRPSNAVTAEKEGQRFFLERHGYGDRVPALLLAPANPDKTRSVTLVVHPEGMEALFPSGQRASLVTKLLAQGSAVLTVDTFLTGESVAPPTRAAELAQVKYLHTYNLTDVGNRVQDILTALAFVRERFPSLPTRLVGVGRAGVWGVLALALDGKADSAVLDLDHFDLTSDDAFLEALNVPCLRRAGDLKTAAALCAPQRLLLHRVHAAFPLAQVADAYAAAGAPRALAVCHQAASEEEMLAWLGEAGRDRA
ncbi:MAG: hypothetical protein QHJ73_19795, partial [Armatimonadota bacterium]|nr:hypothetical protein [Armatimonadota bacterium]